MLPKDALIEVVKPLCDHRLSSGLEIVRFGRVCVLANEISNDPTFEKTVQDAKIVSELFIDAISRDIHQNHPFLMLPKDALIEVVKRLCDHRLSSGLEIVRFGRSLCPSQ